MLDLHPYTLLVTVVVVLAARHFVSAVGKARIQDAGWALFSTVGPFLGNSKMAKLGEKRRDVASVVAQKKKISAQDEYALWTKLNRRQDALNAEIKALSDDLGSSKAAVTRVVSHAISAFTVAPVWFGRFWFRKAVLFYLPQGVLPHYAEWVLALPFGVTGTVGLTVWMFAVNTVLSAVVFLASFPFEASVQKPSKPEKPALGKAKSPAEGLTPLKTTSTGF